MPLPEYTPLEYAEDNGNHCPNCGSENIIQTNSLIAFYKILRNSRCDECYATWDEVFRIVGYENLETP